MTWYLVWAGVGLVGLGLVVLGALLVDAGTS